VSSFGNVFALDVEPGKDVTIDNGHIVAWDARLSYRLSTATSASGGMLGNLVNAATSGEGVVLRFSGEGKVLLASRNRAHFQGWAAGNAQ